MKNLIVTVVFIIICFISKAQTDTIYFNDGTNVIGKIEKQTSSYITIKTLSDDTYSTRRIPMSQIKKIGNSVPVLNSYTDTLQQTIPVSNYKINEAGSCLIRSADYSLIAAGAAILGSVLLVAVQDKDTVLPMSVAFGTISFSFALSSVLNKRKAGVLLRDIK